MKRIQEKKNFDNAVSLIKCKECGNPLDDGNEKILCKCHSCGNVFTGNLEDFATQEFSNNENANKEKIDRKRNITLKPIKNVLVMMTIICFLVSGIFFSKGFNVKNHYYNSDYTSLNKNAYVGGDAYNYIINGTYFTGYVVIASASLLSGVILLTNVVKLMIKIKECED